MGAVVLSPKPDGGHPLIDQPGILSGTDVIGVIRSAREHEVVQRAAAALQPLKQARSSRFKQLARILYGMARDGLFLPAAIKVNKGGTPNVALAITAAIAVPLIYTGAFAFLFKLTAALAILAFFLYELSLFALRRQQPDLARPFRAIGYPVVPALVCLLDLALLVAFIAAEPISGVYMAALILMCVPVALALRHRRNRRAGTAGQHIQAS